MGGSLLRAHGGPLLLARRHLSAAGRAAYKKYLKDWKKLTGS
jgi:hypothetical protein